MPAIQIAMLESDDFTRAGKKIQKVVKLCKNYDLPNQPAPNARFRRRTPGQTRFENQKPALRYKRARIYSAQLGRFISRDPLGFVDGMSLYRAYFVPDGVDPGGLDVIWSDIIGDTTSCSFQGSGGVPDSYHKWLLNWEKRHPNLDHSQYLFWEGVARKGCVGLSCAELGYSPDEELRKLRNGDESIFSACYGSHSKAEVAAQDKKCPNDCSGNPVNPKIVSILFWLDKTGPNIRKGKPGRDGKIDMRCFDPRATKEVMGPFGVPLNSPNFDFGLWNGFEGKYLHANYGGNDMIVKNSSLDNFMLPFDPNGKQSFNREAHCLVCPKEIRPLGSK